MPNNYFKFKQFTIQQEHCAMKVCTDACLFGAWVADQIKTKAATSILDIGAGTGLLSLLLAQKVPAFIDAVEIDAAASQQAKENVEASPWKERLTIIHTDILQLKAEKKYDCIISNPPFFENDLKSSDQNKNAAKHDTTLTLEQLFNTAQAHLNNDASFAVLLPYHRTAACIAIAEKLHLYPVKKALVKQTAAHEPFRTMLLFSNQLSPVAEETIIIKTAQEKYSEKFSQLLKDYYLYL
jgi:tRNA1Val (adenine37-N6)-methyltransferase